MKKPKAERKEEAKEREQQRRKRTNEQQIQILDKRLGEGVGADVERTRLKEE